MALRALTRAVPDCFAAGLTTARLGPVELERARRQHRAYEQALESLGVELLRLPPSPDLPDSCFVEDTAVVLGPGRLLLTRPGHPARRDEVDEVAAALSPYFGECHRMTAPARLDGGDVLRTEAGFLVGLSERTDEAGLAQLAALAPARGMPVEAGLHLKSGAASLGGQRVLCLPELAQTLRRLGLKPVCLDPEEAYAGNLVRVDAALLVAAGFPRTHALLRSLGFALIELDMSEFRKQDGGLSCLSVLFEG